MNKIKKFIYPFAFVIITAVYLMLSLGAVNTFFADDWSGLGILLIAVLIWSVIVIPVYCMWYGKIIRDEKLNVLFAFYNAFVIAGSCMAALIQWLQAYGYIMLFFVWTLFWSLLLPKRRIKPDEDEQEYSEEQTCETDFLLQNKIKNIVVICFVCLYIITLVTSPTTWNSPIDAFSLIPPIVFLVYLLLAKKDYLLKKWMLTFSLISELISGLASLFMSLININIHLKYFPMYPVNLTFSCIAKALIIVMIIGTLFDYKYVKLLKYGALGNAVLCIATIVVEMIELKGFSNVAFTLITVALPRILYFIGFFILTTNKRDTDLDLLKSTQEEIGPESDACKNKQS